MRDGRRGALILERLDRAHIAFGVDRVRADERLIRRVVNVAVGEGADDAGRVLVHPHLFVEVEKPQPFVFASDVRDVGDEPEAVGPWQERSDTGFGAVAMSGNDTDRREGAIDLYRRSVFFPGFGLRFLRSYGQIQ